MVWKPNLQTMWTRVQGMLGELEGGSHGEPVPRRRAWVAHAPCSAAQATQEGWRGRTVDREDLGETQPHTSHWDMICLSCGL